MAGSETIENPARAFLQGGGDLGCLMAGVDPAVVPPEAAIPPAAAPGVAPEGVA